MQHCRLRMRHKGSLSPSLKRFCATLYQLTTPCIRKWWPFFARYRCIFTHYPGYKNEAWLNWNYSHNNFHSRENVSKYQFDSAPGRATVAARPGGAWIMPFDLIGFFLTEQHGLVQLMSHAVDQWTQRSAAESNVDVVAPDALTAPCIYCPHPHLVPQAPPRTINPRRVDRLTL